MKRTYTEPTFSVLSMEIMENYCLDDILSSDIFGEDVIEGF